MNKKLLAIAIAATMAAPISATYASSGVYFSLRPHLVISDNAKTSAAVDNNGSRIGAKTTEDLGNGLKAFARYEIKIDTATSGGVTGGRLGYVGISGAFGAVSLGQQWSPYYNAVGAFDIYEAVGLQDYQGTERIGQTLIYTAPGSDMFSGQLGLVMNGYDATVANDQTGVDQVNAGATFTFGPATLGLGYVSDQVIDNNDLYGATLTLDFDNATLFINGENQQQAVGSDIKTYALVGEFRSGKNSFRAGYSTNDSTNDDHFQLGVAHELTGTFHVWAEYENTSPDVGSSSSVISLGMQKDWS